MNLAGYPDLMNADEVAEILRCSPITVPRLKGLKKTYLYNGRRGVYYFKEDVIAYIEERRNGKEVKEDASKQEKRHRKMGVPSLLSWDELQKA
jgi:hypothetical protein